VLPALGLNVTQAAEQLGVSRVAHDRSSVVYRGLPCHRQVKA